jgi:hypothetical protein
MSRWISAVTLAVCLFPLVAGGLPGLHEHGLQGAQQDIISVADVVGDGAGCSLCALHRSLGQTIPGSATEPCCLETSTVLVAFETVWTSGPVSAGADPRAPPVCDSIWNI